jgi:hypothetical protein
MNERIKELALQATSPPHRSQGYGGEPTHIYPGTLDPEKFAELIVAECMKLNRDILCEDDPDYLDKIYKEHFGVEL